MVMRTPEQPQETRWSAASNPGAANPVARSLLGSSGEPLGAATRAFFEPRFGADFGHVRVHTDARAQEAAASIYAKAFTIGNDIVFAKSEYDPGSSQGRSLIAHELAHVMQRQTLVQRQVVPQNLRSSANVRAMDLRALQGRYDSIVESMSQFNSSTPDYLSLELELSSVANELSRRAALGAKRTFGDTEVAKIKEYFIRNATSAKPKSCIACMNDAMRLLLGDPKQNVGSEVEKTMAKMQASGHAGAARIIEFEDKRGRITYGTLRPEKLHESVWDAVISMVGGDVGWSVFGMSLLHGNHSVTLTLDNGDPATPHVYWSDQWSSKGGWLEYNRARLDAEITRLTQLWWDPQPERRKFNTRVTLWRLNP
jgi:hypothetical protein